MSSDLPKELIDAWRALGQAMGDFWPQAVQRMRDKEPEMVLGLAVYLRRGGPVRFVATFGPSSQIVFEKLEADGTWSAFYTFRGGPQVPLH
jgi:hypothetical protein